MKTKRIKRDNTKPQLWEGYDGDESDRYRILYPDGRSQYAFESSISSRFTRLEESRSLWRSPCWHDYAEDKRGNFIRVRGKIAQKKWSMRRMIREMQKYDKLRKEKPPLFLGNI